MSEGGEWFKQSRRDFPNAAAASMTDQTDPAMQSATQSASDEIIEARVRWLEDQLGRAIPADVRAKVAKQVAANDGMWKRGGKFVMPDGTEPAFVFQPVAGKS
jgi:hypothetical protein